MANPFYYDIGLGRRTPILPLIVASLPVTQSTVIVAPRAMVEEHDHFVQAIYGGLRRPTRDRLALQTLWYRGRWLVLATFDVSLPDDSGRVGLLLTVGAIVHKELRRRGGDLIKPYIAMMFSTLNRMFGGTLPQAGAAAVLASLRNWNSDIGERIIASGEAMLLASYAAGSLTPRWLPHVQPSESRGRLRRPRTILYGDEQDESDIIGDFIDEASAAPALGVSRSLRLDGTDISAIALPSSVIQGTSAARVRRSRGKKYIVLYGGVIR